LDIAISILEENGHPVKRQNPIRGGPEVSKVKGRARMCDADEVVNLARCFPEWKERLRAARGNYYA
jgi:hypothetical protein